MTYRSRKLLDSARDESCASCGSEDGTIVAAHSNQQRDGKGMGTKAADYRIAYLCGKCHFEIDQGSKLTKEERREIWESAHRVTVGRLFERGIVRVA